MKMVNVLEALQIDKILEYSGFDDSAQQTIIAADGFRSYDDILMLGDSDIVNLDNGFSDRTVSVGKISFGLRRTNLLKATIQWDQEFRRIVRTPSLIGIINTAEFLSVIVAARQRASIRKHSLQELAIIGKAANPGKLKRHKDCSTQYRALKNYLLTILGQDGFPLSYVSRESAAQD